jgi:hypothetical protein
MNEVLLDREKLASKLKSDISKLYNTLKEINIEEYNKTSKYSWRNCSDGYSGRIAVITAKGFLKHHTVLYNIDDTSCYKKIINDNDRTIFEVIEEANSWIMAKTEMMKEKMKLFNDEYIEESNKILDTIKYYKSIDKELRLI